MEYRHTPGVVFEDTGKVVMVATLDGPWITLRGSARFIWNLLPVYRPAADVVAACIGEFDGEPETIGKDVDQVLGDWVERDLLEQAD